MIFTNWTLKKAINAAKLCNSISEFRNEYHGAYNFAVRTNTLNLILKKANIKYKVMKWTYEIASKEAKKYDSFKEWRYIDEASYRAAYRYKWLDSILKELKWEKWQRIS